MAGAAEMYMKLIFGCAVWKWNTPFGGLIADEPAERKDTAAMNWKAFIMEQLPVEYQCRLSLIQGQSDVWL